MVVSITAKLRTYYSLGLMNVLRVLLYRASLKVRRHSVCDFNARIPSPPFFGRPAAFVERDGFVASFWQREARLFGYKTVPATAAPPDWLANPFSGKRFPGAERPWWQIPDFDPEGGDIKQVWELSRFDWVLAFAQQAQWGNEVANEHLQAWLANWCRTNAPYRGPNWKCGQEASIRVLNLAMAALIMGQVQSPAQGLIDLVLVHMRRIAPTMGYAMAQDNNHGTSEAAAMFIGGSWLTVLGVREGTAWQRSGRRWLENRAKRLIGEQGGFSQYSVNYHRVMLDTLSMVEVWRRRMDLPRFSPLWYERAKAASDWLYSTVCAETGDAPNVGANDGARLLPLSDTPYRDYRPSVQLAMALFNDCRAYPENGPWNDAPNWMGVNLPSRLCASPGNRVADDGGFAVLRRGAAMVVLRYPRFRFRPGHADALHVDLWLKGENILRDAGTYSYSAAPEDLNYFSGTVGHNTVQFDDRDQMPRISRFLFAGWLKTQDLEPLQDDGACVRFGAGYRDSWGAVHHRRLVFSASELKVDDKVSGFSHKAVLRWRLAPGDWALSSGENHWHIESASGVSMTGLASVPIVRCAIVEGMESRHYLERTPLQVLEVEIDRAGIFQTCVSWSA